MVLQKLPTIKTVNNPIIDLINRCLSIDPADRPKKRDLPQLLEEAFLKDMKKTEINAQ